MRILAAIAAVLILAPPALAQVGTFADTDFGRDGQVDESEARATLAQIWNHAASIESMRRGVRPSPVRNGAGIELPYPGAEIRAIEPGQLQRLVRGHGLRADMTGADASGDGWVSREEFITTGAAAFAAADRNRDGKLSAGEYPAFLSPR